MKLNTYILLTFVLFFAKSLSCQQLYSIPIANGSFEDLPRQGLHSFSVTGWSDCGSIRFPAESPPDIHPGQFWSVMLKPSDGKTYLGLVVRDNETYEGISQVLPKPIESGKCYTFNIDLARSPQYVSASRLTNITTNYTTPTVMRIWGGNGLCSDRELLAESIPISHADWKTYEFKIKSKFNHKSILIEAFYKTPVFLPYCGHLLLDNLSDIVLVPCDENQRKELAEVVPTKPKSNTLPPHKQGRIDNSKKPDTIPAAPVKKKILDDLDASKLKEGHIVEIKNLYFKADAAAINDNSHPVLDEIAAFLIDNPKISIEIGGHTNGQPSHEYCDKLSADRAKSVYTYLIEKGVSKNKVAFKGYGKRRRIASDSTAEGRLKNQRVEIKILSIG